MQYRREIDGLRALAVLPVILFHAGFSAFSGGFVGVDIFFVISGYLITKIITDELQQNTFSLAGFYERRARRILPALFFVMLVCIPFAWALMLPKHLQEFSQSLVAVSAFISNILFWRQSGYFDTVTELKPLLHTWSLAIEEQYYLFYPLFLMFFWRWGRKTVIALCILIFICSLGIAQWASIYKPSANFYLLPSRSWELMLGCFMAFVSARTQTAKPVIAQILSLLGLTLIIASIFMLDDKIPFPSIYALAPTLGAALIIGFANPANFAGKLLGTKLFVGIGLISYSAYLWHQPLLAFTRYAVSSTPSAAIIGVILVATFLLAYFSWRFVEKPFRNRGNFTRKQIFTLSALGMIFFIALGLAGHFNKGFPARMSADEQAREAQFQQTFQERLRLIKGDVCHFNNLTNTGVDNFLEQWNCGKESEPTLKPLPVAVTGDSHAADIVVALRENGYNPLQLAGANCSLVPRYMTPSCKQIYGRLYNEVHSNPAYEYIMLANQFDSKELTRQSIKEMTHYWQRFGKKIIFFSAMPEFHNYEVDFIKGRAAKADHRISKLSLSKNIYAYLTSRDITLINTGGIFCAATDHCKRVIQNGEPYLADSHHMSRIGAKAFGEVLFKDFYSK
ncbi:MAG: acyltransferase family protein [Alphaproteobacteria bacterium]|nr:acyltransferase family protein [Alphaproteobacteria bacterium]